MSGATKKQDATTLENHAGSPSDGSTAEPAESQAGGAESDTVRPSENHAGSEQA